MKITKYALAIALGLVALVAVPAYADTIDYTLNFTTSAGGPTPTGSVSFDTATNMISVQVTWDGLMFGQAGSDSIPSMLPFLIQTQDLTSCSNIGTYSWSVSLTLGFVFQNSSFNCSTPTVLGISPAFAGGTLTDPNAFSASGGWSATLVGSPEPSSLLLLGAGLLGMLGAVRRKLIS